MVPIDKSYTTFYWSFIAPFSSYLTCENSSAETTVAEGGRNPVAGLWGHTLGEN